MYLFTSKSAGFLFWYKFSLCLTLCCTLLSSLAYFAEMTYFMKNITFLIFSPTCILSVEVSTVLTFYSIVVPVVLPWPLPLKACILLLYDCFVLRTAPLVSWCGTCYSSCCIRFFPALLTHTTSLSWSMEACIRLYINVS